MADNPYTREVGRVADGRGREVVVGVNYDTVTLRTTADDTAELDATRVEELGRLILSATWQAAWQTAASLTRAAFARTITDSGTPP